MKNEMKFNSVPTCETCNNRLICVRPRYQNNCLLHTDVEEYFRSKRKSIDVKIIDQMLTDIKNDVKSGEITEYFVGMLDTVKFIREHLEIPEVKTE